MGTSTNAMLVYGYHLGNADDGLEVAEADEDGLLGLDWYDPDTDDDFAETAMEVLLGAAGFTEEYEPGSGYYERKSAAEAALGVEFETHCSGDYPMLILAAKTVTAHRGDADPIDFVALATEAEAGGWDDKLRNALQVLGLTPKQERPMWLLCSYWG